MTLITFRDNTWYRQESSSEFFEFLVKNQNLGSTTENSFKPDFVGLIIFNGNIYVSLPKNFPENYDSVQAAQLILKVLTKYRRGHNCQLPEVPLLYGDQEHSSDLIAVMMDILDDYNKCGVLRRKINRISVNGNGFPDWNKTVKKVIPVMSRKKPIYSNIYTRNSIDNSSDFLTKIHTWVLHECINKIGWLFGLKAECNWQTEIKESDQEIIKILQNELDHIFVEREIRLIKLMMKFINAKNGIDKGEKIQMLAVPHFHTIWEAACGFISDNKYGRLSRLLPQPIYSGFLGQYRIAQRPDILTVNGDTLYIFDAKYYDYNQNAPGWEDIVKQYFYLHTLEATKNTNLFRDTLPEVKQFRNAFLLPENDSEIKFLGNAYVPLVDTMKSIMVIAINEISVLQAYADNDYLKANQIFSRIINLIILKEEPH